MPAVAKTVKNEPLRILHLEDNDNDALLVQRSLQVDGIAAEVKVVSDRAGFEAAWTGQPVDLVLADYRVPGFDGLEALKLVRGRDAYKPFIFVTGFLGEEQAVEMLKSGATDYVLKDRLSRLGMAVRRAEAEAAEHLRREQTEELLRQHREWLKVTLNSIGEAVVTADPAGRVTYLNPQAQKLTGWAEAQAMGRQIQDVFQVVDERTHHPIGDIVGRVLREGAVVSMAGNIAMLTRDKLEIPIEQTAAPMKDHDGRVSGVVFVFHDITERRRAETALKWELAVNEAVSRLSTPLISPETTTEEVAQAVLAQALKLTDSPDGLVSSIDPETRQNVCCASTGSTSGGCALGEKGRRMLFSPGPEGRYDGLCGQALNTGEAFFLNRPSHCHPSAKGLPEEHVALDRLLAVPVRLGTELVGEILAANAPRDYTEKDLTAVARLAAHYGLAIQRLRFKHALQAERDFVQAILTTAGALVVVTDTRGRIVRFNQACERATGYSAQEVIGRVYSNFLIAPEELESVKATFQRLVAGQFPTYHENDWVARDGTRRRIVWSNTALLDENKAVRFAIATGVDVTQAREAQGKLRVLTQAMEAGPSSVVITDAQGNITYVNPTFAHLTGFEAEEVIGQNPRIWKSGQHPPDFYAQLWKTLAGGQEWRGEFCNRKKNGDLFWIYSTISPIKDLSGAISHYVAVTVDITERKRYEQALQQAQQDLEDRVAERTATLKLTIENLEREIEARRRAENEIQELLRFERLNAEISAEFSNVKPGRFESTLIDGIRRLTEFLKAQRAYLVEFAGEDISVTAAWPTDSIRPGVERVSASGFAWSLEQLRRRQMVYLPNIESLPAEAGPDRENYRKAGVQSLVALPLVVSGETIGALGFTDADGAHNWPAQTIARLQRIGDLFAGLLMRWRSEEALSEAETRYHAIADFTQDWEYWESPTGVLLFCSPACERITGLGPQQFLVEPRLLRDIILPEDQALWQEHHAAMHSRPQGGCLQFRIRRADGETRWIEHNCQPVTDDQGNFLGVRASNRDCTSAKQAELGSQRLREELARITRMTTADHLAASLAHELRQPLAAILTNAEAASQFLALEPPDLNEVREALVDIVQNDERASQVILRLRALYRRAGQERTILDLNKLIEETLALLRSELILRQVACSQQLAPQLPLAAANRVELQQVLMNLIFNARDAMATIDPDSRRLAVSTSAEGPRTLRVSVCDSGTGINSDAATHLFEPFFTTKDSGMGMGLAISRTIIEAHGGRLWAANNPVRGATFHFTLPAVQSPAP